MQLFSEMLNDMLVTVFHNIMRVEEEFLQKNHRVNLSIREMHMLEYVGKAYNEGRTLSEIADWLKVARPTVTIAARKLEEKGYLVKNGCARDGRVVRVTLTREGRKVYRNHMRFHMLMVRELEDCFCGDEKELLIRALEKLDGFFEKSIGAAV